MKLSAFLISIDLISYFFYPADDISALHTSAGMVSTDNSKIGHPFTGSLSDLQWRKLSNCEYFHGHCFLWALGLAELLICFAISIKLHSFNNCIWMIGDWCICTDGWHWWHGWKDAEFLFARSIVSDTFCPERHVGRGIGFDLLTWSFLFYYLLFLRFSIPISWYVIFSIFLIGK